MKLNEIAEIYTMCSLRGYERKKTLKYMFDTWRVGRHAKKGYKTGYEFCGYSFDCIDPQTFAFLFTEIFPSGAYRFPSARVDPYIIDGGVNVGLGLAYFKREYPQSRIVGFEPHPLAYEVAQKNIEQNGMQNIDLHNAALTESGDHVTLHCKADEIQASTITNRLSVRGAETEALDVPALRLSDFLDEEVDFLKLDIEGAETSVLREAGSKIQSVKYMLIDVHITSGDTSNDLSWILKFLENQGFYYLLESTLAAQHHSGKYPVDRCGPFTSVSVYAKRKD